MILLSIFSSTMISATMVGQGDQQGSEFTMSITPSYVRTEKATAVHLALRLVRISNFTGQVRFLIEDVPEGITVESPQPITFGNVSLVTSFVTVYTFHSSPVGIFMLNITAISETSYYSVMLELEVVSSLYGDMVVSVADTEGNPVPNAYVAAFFKCCPVPRGPVADEPMAEGFADLNGTITFTHLREGSYSVGTSAEGYLVGGAFFDILGDKVSSGVITMQARTWWDDYGQFVIVGVAFTIISGGFMTFERMRRRAKTPRRPRHTSSGADH